MGIRGGEVTPYIPGLRRYARTMVDDPVEGDDLVQECLARVLAQKGPPGHVRHMRAYLFKVLRNVQADRLSKRYRAMDAAAMENAQGQFYQPATQHTSLELRDLASALARLPDDQRHVIMLVGYEGLSYQDTAEALDVPVGTVMSRLSRGREALRRMTDREVPYLRKVK